MSAESERSYPSGGSARIEKGRLHGPVGRYETDRFELVKLLKDAHPEIIRLGGAFKALALEDFPAFDDAFIKVLGSVLEVFQEAFL